MDAVNLAIAVLVTIGSLLAGVATVVWAVAQIKETTSNLGLEIRHLSQAVLAIGKSLEDHEMRIRRIEQRQHE
jgi:Ca2+/Na+ antiporter